MAMDFLILDCETNSKNPFDAEIIEAYFYVCDKNFTVIDNYFMQSKVDNWSESAAEVHGIEYSTMMQYPDKLTAYNNLFNWLDKHKNLTPVIYSNPRTFIEEIKMACYMHYDLAVIKMQMNILYGNHTKYYKYFNDEPYSPYLEIKKLYKDNVINIAKHKKLAQFSMENVYYNLFNEKYDAHNCINDVIAMLRICKEIARIKYANQSLFSFN